VHKHLRRLEGIWIDAPIYFLTICTRNRRPLLARGEVAKILIDEWRSAHERHGWAIGRYVIMPDHVHFFCRPELDAKPLFEFVGPWKSYRAGRSTRLAGRGHRPRLQRFQNHALGVRVNVKPGRAQEADQRLVAFPCKFDGEARRR
jgi:REP element-mobilizing transposase RayT